MDNKEDDMVSNLTCIFPGDVMINILYRLPVKSLAKCSCVKKSWYYLGHNSLLLSREKESQLLIVRPGCNNFEILGVSNQNTVTIVGSSNGLICLTNVDNTFGVDFRLRNPALREHKYSISIPSGSVKPADRIGSICVGFGYDKKNDDYKILRLELVTQNCQRYFEANLYSLRSESWRMIPYPGNSMFKSSICTSIGSCLFWLSYAGNDTSVEITGFDLSSERSHKILLPKSKNQQDLVQIVAWKDSLAAIFRTNWETNKGYEVWAVSPKQIPTGEDSWELKTALGFCVLPEMIRIRGVQCVDFVMYYVPEKQTNFGAGWQTENVFEKPEIIEYMSNCKICYYRESMVSIIKPPLKRKRIDVMQRDLMLDKLPTPFW